jgi:hypothetical protein
VWDATTGVLLAELREHKGSVRSVAVWKEHTGGHDRIATAGALMVKVRQFLQEVVVKCHTVIIDVVTL